MALERSQIDAKYKWDLTEIYKTEEDFYKDYELCEKKIANFSSHEKTIIKSAKNLFLALSDMTDIDGYIEKLWVYANLSFSTDTSNNAYQALAAKVRNLAVKASAAAWFVTPYVLRLDTETVNAWFCEYPELLRFERLIRKTLAYKPYTLSDECEKLITRIEDCLGTHDEIRNIFANSDMRHGKIIAEDGTRVELSEANYSTFIRSGERRVRAAAFRELYKTYGQFRNTFATVFSGRVKESVTLAKVRGYKNSLFASTFKDEVTPEIYNNLIKTVENGLSPLYEYYELKREALGLKRLHLYDIYAALVGELKKEYTYGQAVSEVLETVKIFGEEYHTALRLGLCERGWVDVYPTKAKRGGAFSAGNAYTEPYILLNFNGHYDDVSTLAHEAGHSMHTYFSKQNNEPHNFHYTIFVAEVASTVNELLLAKRKLKEADNDEERLYILNQLMETYKGALYRQTMFASFEAEMHVLAEKGEPLTADLMSKRYYKKVKKYFGKNVTVDKEIALEWARIPHFYSCFYVYKYATSISAASAIVKRIETEGKAYVDKYIDFLKCGDSKSPLESLLVAGIDMRDSSVIKNAIDDFADCVRQFKEIYTKSK